jgi:hypothetical protein
MTTEYELVVVERPKPFYVRWPVKIVRTLARTVRLFVLVASSMAAAIAVLFVLDTALLGDRRRQH